MRTCRITLMLAASAALAAPPVHAHDGPRAASQATATRTIDITMHDTMRFEPGELSVRTGETVRIVASNKGEVMHEMVIGSGPEIEARRAAMRSDPAAAHCTDRV